MKKKYRSFLGYISFIWMISVIIFILTSLSSCSNLECCNIQRVNMQPCAAIQDKDEKQKCNKKEMEYYHHTGWRYEKYKQR